jgi:3-hydroxybutyryl-CoA dehydrogenase
MNEPELPEQIAVLGAGVMGLGIAQVFAQQGLRVDLYDPNTTVLAKARQSIETGWQKLVDKGRLTPEQQAACLARLTCTTTLAEVRGPWYLEAIPERLDWKVDLFQTLSERQEPEAAYITNTSSLSVAQLAAALPRPDRVAGMHFFNPAPVMQLVEVIVGPRTQPQLVDQIIALTRAIGKVPALVQDSPGFIVNRVARHFYLESLRIVEEGVAEPETVDRLLKQAGFRMGPFELMDLIGLDTNHSVTRSLYDSFFQEPRFRPSLIQQKKVEAGLLGRKTGEGFYGYKS